MEVFEVETEDQARRVALRRVPDHPRRWARYQPAKRFSYVLACRAYRLEDDRISPLPSKEMIRRAMRFSAERRPGDRPPERGMVKRLSEIITAFGENRSKREDEHGST